MSDLTPEGLRKRAVEFMDREFNPEDPQTMTEALARVFTALVAEARQEQDTPDILVLPGLRRYRRRKATRCCGTLTERAEAEGEAQA